MEVLIGPLFARIPGRHGLPELCKRNEDGSPFVVAGHTHNRPHVTAFWGRWKIEAEAPLITADGKHATDDKGEKLWQKLPPVTVSGNGPDSLVLIPAENRHTLTLLDDVGFYTCIYPHVDGEGLTTWDYYGNHDDYR